jgi:hypothetical protein
MCMRPLGLIVLLASVLTLGACMGNGTDTPGIDQTVTLGLSSFGQTTKVTVMVTHSVRIVDPADTGGAHMLCVGTDGHCDANARGPSQLHGPGLALHPGDTAVLTFSAVGEYPVTCTIHPNMNVTISVTGLM